MHPLSIGVMYSLHEQCIALSVVVICCDLCCSVVVLLASALVIETPSKFQGSTHCQDAGNKLLHNRIARLFL